MSPLTDAELVERVRAVVEKWQDADDDEYGLDQGVRQLLHEIRTALGDYL